MKVFFSELTGILHMKAEFSKSIRKRSRIHCRMEIRLKAKQYNSNWNVVGR